MQKALSIWLAALCVLITFQQAVIVLHFELNREAIEIAFCINKNNPSAKCHGSCHLKKQLQEAEGSKETATISYSKIDIFILAKSSIRIENVLSRNGKTACMHSDNFYKEPFREIWVPPPIANI